MKKHTMRVFVIASRPFPEKVSNGRFYINEIDAHRDYLLIEPDELRHSFAVYQADVSIFEKPVKL